MSGKEYSHSKDAAGGLQVAIGSADDDVNHIDQRGDIDIHVGNSHQIHLRYQSQM